MSDPSQAMQKAINDALLAANELDTAMGGTANIYDQVPASPTYPYVRIGEDQALDLGNACFPAWELFATLHIFARQITNLGARPLAKRIGGPAQDAVLSLEDSVHEGFKVDEAQFRSSDYFMEKDGITAHGVVVCRLLITPA